MIITAASFPTPEFIKTTNNPAVWDQKARFADFQAAAANQALERLSGTLDRLSTPGERSMAFVQLYRDLAEWRYQLAQTAEGQSPGAELEQYHSPIGGHRMLDRFGPGRRRELTTDPATGLVVRVAETPGSRTAARLGALIEARFQAELPPRVEMLQNHVRLPDGRTIPGNVLMRGSAAAEAYGIPVPPEGIWCTMTGLEADRRALQQEAFTVLGDLETQRAEGRADLVADPAARRAFTAAEYYLYQGPEYQRGGDATIRVLLAASHTRIFGAAPKLPQDIDLMAYVAGQHEFHRRLDNTQAVLSTPGSRVQADAGHQSAVRRPQQRGVAPERG
ncbi:hypothetical protein ACIBL3_31840 [Kribbella sp. NPDC050124]|uniref:hypothetical protein n=1 Tax=Kribbella sp. NPDC050124 TaxID=3364114 RepID=UPI00379352EC